MSITTLSTLSSPTVSIILSEKRQHEQPKYQQPLLEDYRKRDITYKAVYNHEITKKVDPIQRYNHIIDRYNTDDNIYQDIHLQTMPYSQTFHYIWTIITNPIKLLILLLGISTPIIGFVLYYFVICASIHYRRCLLIYRNNRKLIQNPFRNMVYAPEICRKLNIISKFFLLQVKDLKGFSFNREVISNLSKRERDGKVRFMIYDERLWEWYRSFPRLKATFIMIFLASTLLVAIQINFILFIVHLFNNSHM